VVELNLKLLISICYCFFLFLLLVRQKWAIDYIYSSIIIVLSRSNEEFYALKRSSSQENELLP